MKYFTDGELCCKHCGIVVLHPGFGDALDELRETYGKPLVALSGCRCKVHNDKPADQGGAGGHPLSLHVGDVPAHADLGQKGCMAIDLAAVKGPERGELFVVMWKLKWSIGWNAKRGFLHGDMRVWLGMQQTTFDY